MVRCYLRKTEGPSWSKETLTKAIEAVRSNRLSGYEAAKTYDIPRKTIMDHVTGRRGAKSSTQGRPTVLQIETEQTLAECLHVMESPGTCWQVCSKEQLSYTIYKWYTRK